MSRPVDELRNLRPERVCLIKPSALGDVVSALPVLSSLRTLWPEAAFAWVVNQSFRGLLEGHPELDEVIVYDRSRAGRLPGGIATFAKFLIELRDRRFDLAIDLQGLLRSGIMAQATGASVRVGLADAREGASRFYTHRVPAASPEAHAVDRLLPLAEAFGGDISAPKFVLAIAEADRAWARDVLECTATPRVIFNLGASWATKRWPPEHFAEIARRAVAARGAGLVVVGAHGDRAWVEAFRERLPAFPVLDLCGATTLPQLAALAAESDLIVSNDSGPLHLAAASGTRVVGIYTCTNPRRNGPYGPNARSVATGVWCAGSYLMKCDRLECFAELTPDRVWPVVLEQLDAVAHAETAV